MRCRKRLQRAKTAILHEAGVLKQDAQQVIDTLKGEIIPVNLMPSPALAEEPLAEESLDPPTTNQGFNDSTWQPGYLDLASTADFTPTPVARPGLATPTPPSTAVQPPLPATPQLIASTNQQLAQPVPSQASTLSPQPQPIVQPELTIQSLENTPTPATVASTPTVGLPQNISAQPPSPAKLSPESLGGQAPTTIGSLTVPEPGEALSTPGGFNSGSAGSGGSGPFNFLSRRPILTGLSFVTLIALISGAFALTGLLHQTKPTTPNLSSQTSDDALLSAKNAVLTLNLDTVVAKGKTLTVGQIIAGPGSSILQITGDVQSTGTLYASNGQSSLSNSGLKINNVVVCTSTGCSGGTTATTTAAALTSLPANVTQAGNSFNGSSQLLQLTSAGLLPALSGANLTNLNATNISSGSLADARLSANVALLDGSPLFKNTADSTTAFRIQNALGTNLVAIDTVAGTVTVVGLQGSGANLTSLNASNISSGTLADGRLSTNVSLLGQSIDSSEITDDTIVNADISTTAAIGWTKLDKTGSSLADLTTRSATDLSSGTLADTRLSTNVALLNGSPLFKNTANSTTAFQIQNAAGTSNLLVADTTSTRIGIGTATPAYTLDVAGDINSSTGLRVNGALLCNSGGCTASGGSNNYVQNGTALQTANFNIQSASTTSVTGTIRAATSQTADLLQLKDQASVNVLTIGPTGNSLFQPSTNSINAFAVKNAAGTSLLIGGDTLNARVAIATAVPPVYTLDVGGDINSSTGLRVGGTLVCASGSGCTAAAGSGSYVQNGTTLQTANYAIQSAANSSIVAYIRGASGQSADLLDVVGIGAGNVALPVATFGAAGATLFQNAIDSTTAFRLQNLAGNNYLLVNTSGASISLGDTSIASTIQIGNTTGAVAQTINIGNNATAASATALTLGNAVSGTTFTAEAGTGTTALFNGATAHTLQIGSGAAVQGITLGSTNSTSATTINAGTGNLNIGNDSVAKTTTINIGAEATGADLVALGSTNATSTTTIEAGTAATAIQIGNGATAHGIQIGSNATGDNDILLGGANAGSTLNIEAGTAPTAIQIGNGATAHGIQIGTGAAIQTVVLGSASSSSITTINAGTAGLNLGNNGVANTIQIGNTTGAVAQTIAIGNNATALSTTTLTIGNTVAGITTLQSAGGVAVSTLGSADSVTYLCRNTANLLASCQTAATGSVFTQGGNSFAATATLGTNDANSLSFETSNTTQVTIAVGGATTFKNSADSTAAFQIQNAATNPYLLVNTSGASISVGDTSIASTIQIGNTSGAVAQTINVGNNATAASTTTLTLGNAVSGTTFTAESGTAATAIQIGNGATAHGIQIGTGAAIQTVVLGSANSSSITTINAGSAGLNLGNNGVANTIQIGNTTGAVAQTIAIGNNATGASTNAITIGNLLGTSATTIQGGTGASAIGLQAGTSGTISLGTTNVNTVTIGSTANTGTLTFGQATTGETINIGNGNVATGNTNTINIGATATSTGKDVITIGSLVAASTLALQGGTGATAIAIQVGASGTISVGTTSQTSTLNLGNASASSSLTLEAGTAATAIQIGNGATAHGIQIGTGAAAQTLVIGSTNTSSTTTIQSGTGNINLNPAGATGAVIVKPGTDNVAAFQVQNAAGTSNLLVADTTNTKLGIAMAPSSTGDALQVTGSASATTGFDLAATGNSSSTITKSTVVTTAVNANDVVIIDTSNAAQVKTTATQGATGVFGIATSTQASTGQTQNIAISGVYQVTADTAAVSIGDKLVTATTTGQVTPSSNTEIGTVIGRALSSKAAGSSGLVWVVLDPGTGGSSSQSNIVSVQTFTSGSGTYTKPSGVTAITVELLGAGGGGSGSGSTGGTAPGTGGNTTFGSSLLTGNGGAAGGFAATTGGAGGSASIGAGASGTTITGGQGGGVSTTTATADSLGGQGGSSVFGGGSQGGRGAAIAGATNTGAGGSGAGGRADVGTYAGDGGGAGGYVKALITQPSATYSYAVGAAGTAGGAGGGGSGSAGAGGGSGIIIVTEYGVSGGTTAPGAGAGEVSYTEFTSNVSITATTEATANTVVTAPAYTFDGSTPYKIEFFSPVALPASSGILFLWLYDGSSSIGQLTQITTPASQTAYTATFVGRRLTPSNASHTYSIRASVNTGAGTVYAGAGGAGAYVPGYIRITPALGSGNATTLQGAYDMGRAITTTDARDISITLADTTTDSNFLVNVATSSTSKFALQNNGADAFSLSSTGDSANLLTNGGLEVDTTGWSARGSATLSRTTSSPTPYQGLGQLKVVTTAAANDGAKNAYALVSSTQYSLTAFARLDSGSAAMATFQMGRADDGSTDTSCLTAQTVVTGGWTKFSCTFTTGTTSGSPYIYFKQTDAAVHTYYLDAVKLETGASATAYKEGGIALNGTIGSPTTFKNQSDSTAALSIQNNVGTPLFQVDTLNNLVYIGNPTADATAVVLVLDTKNTAGDPTGVNGGMYYNSNTNKFRCYENSAWVNCRSSTVSLKRTAGNFTLNNVAWTEISASLLDLTIPAQAGDVLRWSMSGYSSSAVTKLSIDAKNTTSGTRWANTDYFGIAGLRNGQVAQAEGPNSGFATYTVVSGDISGGNVTVRPMYRTDAASDVTFFASDPALYIELTNLGP